MRKNHISGKMKRILAVACAAMLAVSSVPANTVAYASEAETTQEAEVQNDNKGAGENNDATNENSGSDNSGENSGSGNSGENSGSGNSGENSGSGNSGENSGSGKSGEETSESGKSGETSESGKSGETSESGKSGETSESGKSGETSESGQSGKDNKNDKEPEQDTTNPKVTAVELSEDKEKIEIKIEEENISEDGWTYSCKKDGEEKSKTVKTNTFTIDPKTEWGDGIYTDFQISGKDASGNPLEFGEGLKAKLDGIKITIDTKAPKVTAVELSGDKEKIEITIEEENISEDGWTYSCKKNGEEKSKTVKANTFTIDPKSEWGEGIYTDFQISGKDASGNTLEFGEGLKAKLNGIKITIDTKAPKVTAVELSKDKEKIEITIEEENTSEVGWTYSCKKDGEEKSKTVKNNTFTIDPKESWGDGTYTDFQISGKDASGKSLEFGEGLKNKLNGIKITIDTKAPVININTVKVSVDDGEEGALSEISFGKKIKYTFEVDEPNLETLKYHISHVKIDNQNPDTTNWTTISDHSFTVETDAKGYVYVYAEDAYEHHTLNSFKALVVEKTAPLIDFTVTNGDKLNPEVKINKVTDNVDEDENPIDVFSGIREVYYTVDGGSEKHYVLKAPATAPTSFDALLGTAAENKVLDLNDVNGKHKLTIHAIDWCGNEGKEETTELLFDHKAPEVYITPIGFVNYENTSVTNYDGELSILVKDEKDATETEEHKGTVDISVNGVIKIQALEYTSNKAFNVNLSDLGIDRDDENHLTDGNYTIKITATDERGNATTKLSVKDGNGNNVVEDVEEFAFDLDTTPPKVSCEVITAGEVLSDYLLFNTDSLNGKPGVEVKFTVTDDHMSTDGWSYNYTLDGTPTSDSTAANNWSGHEYTLIVGKNKEKIVDGWYREFNLIGNDVVGNAAENDKSPVFLISTEVPTITISMDSDNSGIYHSNGGFYVYMSFGNEDNLNPNHDKAFITKYQIIVKRGDGKEYKYPETEEESNYGRKVEKHIEDSVLSADDVFGSNVEDEFTVTITATTNRNNETNIINEEQGKIEINSNQTQGKYYYDKVAPRLVSVTSKPSNEEAQFNPGVGEQDKYYYVSDSKVTDTYEINDKYPGITKVSYFKDDAVEPTEVKTPEDATEKERKELNVVLEGENNKFSDFKVEGEDLAGNKLVKATKTNNEGEEFKSFPDGVNEADDGDAIFLKYGKVLDTVAPKLVSIITTADNDFHYYINNEETMDGSVRKDGDDLCYVSDDSIIDTYTVEDDHWDSMSVSYLKDGIDVTEKSQGNTLEINLNGEGIYSSFIITGADKAGNALVLDKGYNKNSSPYSANDGDGSVLVNAATVNEQEKAIYLTNGKVLDISRPAVTLEVNTAGNLDKDSLDDQGRRYYNSSFTGTFTVDDNYTLTKGNITAELGKADGDYYPELTDFSNRSEMTADANSYKKYTSQVIADFKDHQYDGNYRFFISGTDKAGNKIKYDVIPGTEQEKKLFGFVEDDKTGYRSNDKIMDTTAPSAELSVLNGDKAFYKLVMTASNYNLESYDPYQKKIESKVKLGTEDKSPVYFIYNIDSTVEAGKISGIKGGYTKNANNVTVIPAREQIITIKDLIVKDMAGNLLALKDDPNNENPKDGVKKTLHYSNLLVFDSTKPTTKPKDIVAPSATIKATSRVTHRNADGRDLFNHAVTLNVTITDPGAKTYSSGLKETSYSVYVDGNKVDGKVNKEYGQTYGSEDALNQNTAVVQNDKYVYTQKYTINLPSSAKYQSNNIEIHVDAVDRSGNKMETVKYRCGIDTIGPDITVDFGKDSPQNEKYFKADRTCTITVKDRNVDNGKIHINTQVSVPGSFSYGKDGGNGANDTWVKKLYYNKDGDYTLDLPNCTDALGNKAKVTYKGAAPKAFTVDKTIPVIYVTFDNNSSQNGKYYKDPRAATVRIHEHNFRASDVKINQTATIQKGSVSAPGVSGFGGGGDDHSASINYSNDGNYTIEVNYTDLAGNPAKVVKVDEFVIDRTKPVVKFVTPDKNNMVFQDAIAPQIEYSDINTTRGMASISLKGMKKSNVLEVVEDTFSDYQGTVRFENLKKVRENDDIYVATAVVTDLAGNEESVSITFSVNRFGSTYDYNNDPFTTNLVQNYFANEEGDVVLREINVNKLTERSLTLYKDGDNRKLVEGTDFKVDENTVNGHYEYIYTIFKANFEEEGNYNIIATSKDEAKNTNSNSSVKGNDGSNEVPLRFAIDKTEPTNEVTGVDITKNKFTESEITLDIRPLDNMNAVAKFLVRVLDKDGNELAKFEMSGEELAKYLEEHDGVYQLTVEQNTGWQTIEIVTTDAAGNQSTDYTIADNTAYNVLVTPNLFVQYINRLPLVLLTVAAVAGIIFFIIWKRKKDQEDETAA